MEVYNSLGLKVSGLRDLGLVFGGLRRGLRLWDLEFCKHKTQ